MIQKIIQNTAYNTYKKVFLYNDREQMDMGGSQVDGPSLLEGTVGGSQEDDLPRLRIPRYLHAMHACNKRYRCKFFYNI